MAKLGRSRLIAPLLWAIQFLEKAIYYLGRLIVHARMQRLFPGKRVLADYSTIIKHPERIDMGDNVWIGPSVSIGAMGGIVIEDWVRISQGAYIETGSLDLSASPPYPHIARPIHIEHGVWIGAHAIILGGVRIGRQAVVAAGALVVKDVPSNAVVGGVPARILSYRPEGEPS
jgi:acetyltransferase-like isoleucine patch superfamily enzyme